MAETQVRTVYTLSAFDSSAAMAGALCVMYEKNRITFSDTTPTQDVSNITVTNGEGTPNTYFIGAGICTFREPNKFYFLYDSVYYIFNEKGIGVSANSIDYQLYSAKLGDVSKAEVQTVGRFIKVGVKVSNTISELQEPTLVDDSQLAPGNNTFDPNDTPVVNPGDTTVGDETSGGSGDNSQGGNSETGVTGGGNNNQQTDEENQQTPTIDPDARPVDPLIPINNTRKIEETTINYASSFTSDANVSTVEVDSLNARDQFATQVLNGMLAKLPNPAGLSDNEMNYYCNASYQWAANMMAAAARTRTSVNVADGASISNTESIGSLDNNTEKLLNNLVVVTTGLKNAQESTRETITTGSGTSTTTTYSERVTLKDVTMSDLQKLLEQKSGKTVTTEGGVPTTTYTGKSPFETDLITKIASYLHNNHVDANDPSLSSSDVGLSNLIKAIRSISITASGGNNTVNIDTQGIESKLQTLAGTREIQIDTTGGAGSSSSHPFYISGGAFPERDALATSILPANISDVVAFVSSGGVGYATIANLASAVLTNMVAADIMTKINTLLNTKIAAWINAATGTVSGNSVTITANTPSNS